MRRLAALTLISLMMLGKNLDAETLEECAAMTDDAARVKCYDKAAGRDATKSVSSIAASCEAGLLKRLFSPSTYRRIDITEVRKSISIDEYVDNQLFDIRDRYLDDQDRATLERAKLRQREAKMRADDEHPTQVDVTITYEAQNRMGGSLRAIEECEPVIVTR